eukprot:SAG11_NODE_21626_length_421_cov_1.562112_1_plen_49_part_10
MVVIDFVDQISSAGITTDVLPFKHRIRVIPACIILHLKLSTFFVLKLVL